MLVRVFSINKFKSACIKDGKKERAKNPPGWTSACIGREVNNNRDVVGTYFGSEFEWTSYVDEKYVRR